IALDSRLHTASRKATGSGRQPIAFLHLEFLHSFHAQLALGEASAAGKHRAFIVHPPRAFWRHAEPLETASPPPDVAHRLAASDATIELLDVGTELPQSLDAAGACRIREHAFRLNLRAATDQCGSNQDRSRAAIAWRGNCFSLHPGVAADDFRACTVLVL